MLQRLHHACVHAFVHHIESIDDPPPQTYLKIVSYLSCVHCTVYSVHLQSLLDIIVMTDKVYGECISFLYSFLKYYQSELITLTIIKHITYDDAPPWFSATNLFSPQNSMLFIQFVAIILSTIKQVQYVRCITHVNKGVSVINNTSISYNTSTNRQQKQKNNIEMNCSFFELYKSNLTSIEF